MLSAENLTHHCQFEAGFAGHQHQGDACAKTVRDLTVATVAGPTADGASYNVFAWPAESPSHGPQVVVTDPSDPMASPFGWHDTDGQDGAEFTITRGNNTDTYVDATNEDVAFFPQPDGGDELAFDFEYDTSEEPFSQTDATTVNLFYAVNRFHDFMWHYGFDEPAGNFQTNNYGNGGTRRRRRRGPEPGRLFNQRWANRPDDRCPQQRQLLDPRRRYARAYADVFME